jgi:hypothetical protein
MKRATKRTTKRSIRSRRRTATKPRPVQPIQLISEGGVVLDPDDWMMGFAHALAKLWQISRDGNMVRRLMDECRITERKLLLADVGEYDRADIRSAMIASKGATPPSKRGAAVVRGSVVV